MISFETGKEVSDMSQLKQFASAVVLAAAALFAAMPADATTILTFGQTLGGTPITATNSGGVSTTISGTNVGITVTQIDAALITPFAAFLNLSATSVGIATTASGFVTQAFSGTFTITSGLGGTGTNYLSGTFTDAVFGKGASLVLSAAQPPNLVTYTSSVIPAGDLGLDRGLALSFANVTPPVHITGTSLGSFHSSISGTFSANVPRQVPEPGSLALVGLAMLGLVGLLRRKS